MVAAQRQSACAARHAVRVFEAEQRLAAMAPGAARHVIEKEMKRTDEKMMVRKRDLFYFLVTNALKYVCKTFIFSTFVMENILHHR